MEINDLCKEAHQIAKEKGFWTVDQSIPTKLMLIVSELSESMEADRKGDKEGLNRELADVWIRLADLCEWLDIDIEHYITRKMKINKDRPYLHNKKY